MHEITVYVPLGIVPSAFQGEGKHRQREYKGQRILVNGHNEYT